jgi:hypothetical protein
MLDREPLRHRGTQAPDRRCGQPHGLVPAVGGLPQAANRRMIGRSEAGIWEMSHRLRSRHNQRERTYAQACADRG